MRSLLFLSEKWRKERQLISLVEGLFLIVEYMEVKINAYLL